MSRKLTTRRAIGLAAATIAAAPVLAFSAAQAAGTGPTDPAPGSTTPAPATCTTIAYETAKLLPRPWWQGYSPFPRYTLVVTGRTPYYNQTVKLVPHVYIQQPEYWGIEVQGCLTGGVGLPAQKPYTLRLDVGATTGSKGVEIIGSNQSQRFDIPPRVSPPTTRTSTKPTPPTGPIIPPPR
jgi:hypothetical protein